MAPVPRREFAAALGRLGAESLARLTADLWAARGYDTDRDGRRVVVRDPESDGERVLVAHDATGSLGRVVPGRRRAPPRPAAVGADVVVTNAAATGPGVTGVADLRRALLYAVPPATGDALCRRHLGMAARRERGHGRGRDRSPTAVAGALAAVVALVAIAALAAGVPVEERPGDAGGERASPSASTPGGGVSPARAGSSPPGVTAESVRDADALADAHVAALRGRSYVWTVTYREYRDGNRTVFLHQYTTVAGPRRYASTIKGWGDPSGTAGLVLGPTTYADGTVRYEATGGTVSRRPLPAGNADAGAGEPTDRFAGRAGRLVAWYLSTDESVVERVGPDRVRIRATADPWPGTVDETTTAVVREDGLVLELRRRHGRPDSNVTVAVAFTYRALGTATVERPTWVPDDGNRSDGGEYDSPYPSNATTPREP